MSSGLTLSTEYHDAAVQDALERVLARVDRPREVLDDIGQQWVARTHDRFERGGYPQKWKKKRDGSASHLRDRGHLERSVHASPGRGTVTLGTQDRKAAAHQLGLTIRPRRRRYLSIPLKKGRQYQAGAGAFFRRYPGRVFSYFDSPTKGTVMMTHPGSSKKAEPIFVLRRKVKMPKRPFLLATAEDRRAFVVTLESYLTGPLS